LTTQPRKLLQITKKIAILKFILRRNTKRNGIIFCTVKIITNGKGLNLNETSGNHIWDGAAPIFTIRAAMHISSDGRRPVRFVVNSMFTSPKIRTVEEIVWTTKYKVKISGIFLFFQIIAGINIIVTISTQIQSVNQLLLDKNIKIPEK